MTKNLLFLRSVIFSLIFSKIIFTEKYLFEIQLYLF